MSTLNSPDDLSSGAWEIIQAAYGNYEYAGSKEFEDFTKLNFSNEELRSYCQELHDKRYVFWEDRNKESMYLYLLDKTFYCFNP